MESTSRSLDFGQRRFTSLPEQAGISVKGACMSEEVSWLVELMIKQAYLDNSRAPTDEMVESSRRTAGGISVTLEPPKPNTTPGRETSPR